MKRMIIDAPNILFRVYAMNQEKIKDAGVADEEELQRQLGFCLHVALSSVLKHYRKHKPDQLAVVFEGSQNWRKAYTQSAESISKAVYKANRVRDPSITALFELVDNFRQLVTHHTSIVSLHCDYLEGDDLIAGYTQRFAAQGDDVIIVSSDKDFMQLYRLPNVKIINPDTGKDRLEEAKFKDFDPMWYLFEKCMRGDGGDNVPSAYPRLRTTKIRAAFEDEYAKTQLMNSTWKIVDPDDPENEEKWTVFRVGDLFNENKLLVDLFEQPPEVRSLIDETLDVELETPGKWNMFHFLRFCGKYDLNQIADNVANYADMFAATGRHAADTTIKRINKNKPVETTYVNESVTMSADDLLTQIANSPRPDKPINEVKKTILEF